MGNQYTVDGYVFQNASDYERALKEKETIAYLSANTDMANMKDVYKIYKLSVEKVIPNSFRPCFFGGVEETSPWLGNCNGRYFGANPNRAYCYGV